jgi:hypothetical protein
MAHDFDEDFETDSMRYKASERIAYAIVNTRCIGGSPIYGTTPDRCWDGMRRHQIAYVMHLAKRMARVCTPYWPCSDLKRSR